MQLTRAADYAVRVMIHLALLPPGARVQRDALADATGVPESFMSKVLQALVRERMISSRRGQDGGFQLAVPAGQTSLLEVVEAIEGPIALNFCLGAGEVCERVSFCAAHFIWADAQAAMARVLKSASIAQLAERTRLMRCVGDHSDRAGNPVSALPVSGGPAKPGIAHQD